MTRSARRKLPPDQFEFFFETPAVLPSEDALRCQAVDLLRALNLRALAAAVRVTWNSRMRTTVGRADPAHQLITLNPALARFGRLEIDRTLRHELAHLVAHARWPRRRLPPHGAEWRRACLDLGLADEKACHRLPLVSRTLPRRYLYRCPHCHLEFPRVRRFRRATACLPCCRRHSQGRFETRFQLQLVKPPRVSNLHAIPINS